jgi:hypothetical protein
VSAAGISVSPSTGAIGTTTTVSGNGFAANTTVRVFFNGSGGSQIGQESSDGSGNLPNLTVTIPNVVAGSYQIFATDGSNTATTTFTVPSSLSLSATSGGQGTSVTVSGTGYLSGEGISIAWDQAGNQVASATANSNGGFTANSFSVPSNSGTHTVLATGQSSHFAQSATFTVSGNTGGANLSVSPTSGAAGSTVTLNGSGFNANEQVNIAVDNGGTTSLTADGNGNFSNFNMTLSSSLALGAHIISATGASSGHVAFATFSVTSTNVNAQQPTSCTSGDGDQDDSRSGNGNGDENHCHTGSQGHHHENDQGNHGHGHHGNGDGNDQGEDD